MTVDESAGAANAETSGIGTSGALGRERRMTAGRKRDAVLRLLRGEFLETVGRELTVTAADLNAWRDALLEASAASLKTWARDHRDETIDHLQWKLSEGLLDNELRYAKFEWVETGAPFTGRRSKQ